MWNGPMEVTIDDLFIILGPNLNIMSHDESYIEEDGDALEDSYDEANMYNIFEHQLKLRRKNGNTYDVNYILGIHIIINRLSDAKIKDIKGH